MPRNWKRITKRTGNFPATYSGGWPIEDLETVLHDGIRRFAYWNEKPWDGRTHSFLYHAIILLGELRATESLPAVLDQLRQGMEYNDFWFADWSDDIFQTPLHHLGRENLGVIQDFVKEPLIEAFYKNQAAKVVELTALLEPERRGELIEWYRHVIQHFLDNAEDEDLIDTTFLAFLIMDIAKVGFKELKPLAKQVFERELATYGIMGNWKDAKKEFDESSADDENWYYGDAFKQYEALQEAKDAIKKTRERERDEQIAEENRKEAARKASLKSWTLDEPIRVEKIGRNERVTVKYLDGTIKQDLKYKSVEDDVAAGKAVLV